MRIGPAAALTVVLVVTGCAGGTGSPGQDPETSAAHPRPEPARDASASSGPTPSQDSLDERLRAAAWRNDLAAARRLVRRGADVNAKDETDQSAYLIATSEGYLDLLRLTLRHGARVDDKDSWNGTGLIRAAERGHAAVVGELLQAGIARDHVNRIGYQAVHEAVWLGEDTSAYETTLRVLAAGGVRLSDRSVQEGLTPLQMAGQRGHERLERVLTNVTTSDRPADPDAALLAAAATGDADAAAATLRAGADLEARDAHRRTPLLLAATHDHLAVAGLLVAMGADPDPRLETSRADG